MPSDIEPIKIIAKAVERAVDPTGVHSVRVRLTHTTPEGVELEWSIWVPNEESFDRAVDLARKELDRISTQIARQAELVAPAADAEAAKSQPDRGVDEERERRRRDRRIEGRSGWAA